MICSKTVRLKFKAYRTSELILRSIMLRAFWKYMIAESMDRLWPNTEFVCYQLVTITFSCFFRAVFVIFSIDSAFC